MAMASSLPACRDWRARSALFTLLRPPPDHPFPNSLPDYISALQSPDLGFKTEVLHRLSSFLLCVAPTSPSYFTCPDLSTISTQFGNKEILLNLQDIYFLHNLLFADLTKYTAWLIGFKMDEHEADSNISLKYICNSSYDRTHLALSTEVLRCCIRILPFMEFNTHLSLVAADTLKWILERLCCPVNICQLIGRGTNKFGCWMNQLRDVLNGTNCLVNRGDQSGDSPPWICSVEACIKNLQELVSSHQNMETSFFLAKGYTGCEVNDAKASIDPDQIACALLEIFMDELVLQPGLVDAFVDHGMDTDLDSSLSGDSFYGRCATLHMEAVVAHWILSFSKFNDGKCLLPTIEAKSFNFGSRLSLPAAVVMFDLSVADVFQVPCMLLVHIMSFLIRSLDNDSCSASELPREMVLSLAASVLESATDLYSRLCSVLSKELDSSKLDNSSFNVVINRFWAFCDRGDKNTDLVSNVPFNERHCFKGEQFSIEKSLPTKIGLWCMDDAIQQGKWEDMTSSQTPLGSRGSTPDIALVVSTLQLITASLHRLVTEADKHDLALQEVSLLERGNHCPSIDVNLYLKIVKEAFKFCVSKDKGKISSELKLEIPFGKLLHEGDGVTGHAFLFFIERYLCGCKQGAPKILRTAYWHVLKSLTRLLIFTDRRNKGSKAVEDEPLCPGSETITSFVCTDKVVQEPNLDKSCLSGSEHELNEFRTSTFAITKIYRHKRNKIILEQRDKKWLFEAEPEGESDITHVDAGSLKSQQKQSFGNCKPVLQNRSTSSGGNSYIEEMLKLENKSGQECFNDLEDFIVCKEGRNYGTWMKSHLKRRAKRLRRSYWKRLREKRTLISLLSCKSRRDEFFELST